MTRREGEAKHWRGRVELVSAGRAGQVLEQILALYGSPLLPSPPGRGICERGREGPGWHGSPSLPPSASRLLPSISLCLCLSLSPPLSLIFSPHLSLSLLSLCPSSPPPHQLLFDPLSLSVSLPLLLSPGSASIRPPPLGGAESPTWKTWSKQTTPPQSHQELHTQSRLLENGSQIPLLSRPRGRNRVFHGLWQ